MVWGIVELRKARPPVEPEEFQALPEYQALGPAERALVDRWYAMTPEEQEAFAERANQNSGAIGGYREGLGPWRRR